MARETRLPNRLGMKTFVLNRCLLILIVCAGAALNPLNAQQVQIASATMSSGSTARLIVNRSAAFGFNESVNLFVDGAKVASLGYNGSYQGELPAGKHVLSISTDPKTYAEGESARIAINAKPGQTYSFTAVWPDSERAGLVAN